MIYDIIAGTIDWIRIKMTRTKSSWPIYWWPQDNRWKTCVKTRIIERKMRKLKKI